MKETVTLKYPLDLENRGKVLTVQLRRPKVRDIEAVEKYTGDYDRTINLIANLAEWSPDEVRELDLADYKRLSETISGFLDGAPNSSR